jgi:proton-coupled amino acid transporter
MGAEDSNKDAGNDQGGRETGDELSSSFQPGSPFRQASLRLGSPVPNALGGLSPHQRGEDDETAIEEQMLDDDAHSASQFDVRRSRRDSPAMSGTSPSAGGGLNDSGMSVHSVDIDNPDPEVVKVVGRHLVKDSDMENNNASDQPESSSGGAGPSGAGGGDDDGNAVDDKFTSLRLQGGDITRQLYNWQREHGEGEAATKRGRSRSFDIPRSPPRGPNEEVLDIKNIKAPGGFRRNFIVNKVQAQDPESLTNGRRPAFLTRNFIEFLSIYGHFAGEELEDDEMDDYSSEVTSQSGDGEGVDERTALLRRRETPRRHMRRKSSHAAPGNASVTKVVLLIFKSFVGTGILFLPRAFFNGGVLFSPLVLLLVSMLSVCCFVLLIHAKEAVGVNSFGDVGGALYGPKMRYMILMSIVLSQIGFSAAYIVFTSENLRALILSLSQHQYDMSIQALIFLQLILFMPLAMIRDIAKLSGTALVADFFIFLGLIYLYACYVGNIAADGVADVKLFQEETYTLFIGTAIFTFEGVGLIIPIQESMKQPKKFLPVMCSVMVVITLIFVSTGTLGYAAYGSNVKTVVILNLPQDSHFVNAVQLLYSLAIILSTPLQLFPAIRIMENGLFIRSGKYSKKIKWEKNFFRAVVVLMTACISWIGADDLDKFVSLTGSFACIPLVCIYPPLLHIKSRANTVWLKALDIFLLVLGFCAMIYTTSNTLASWLHG